MSRTIERRPDRMIQTSVRPGVEEELTIGSERGIVETRLGPLDVRVVGAGPIAVFWHSLFVDSRSWERIQDDLGSLRRLVIITGPGHGSSGDTGRHYTLEDCADAAATVLDTLGFHAPVDWVGNAWGGHVGILLALRWPERCRSLVTLGSPIRSLSRPERTRTNTLLLAYRLLGPARFIRKGVVDTLLSPRTRAHDPAAVALVDDCLVHADRNGLRNAIVSISLQRSDLTDRLPQVSVPTLFVTGSDHKGWSQQQAVAASKLLAHGSAAVVDGSSYLVPLEDSATTVRLVRSFWCDH